MHLVDALAAGIRGAENGTATIYRRGTATRALWYLSFEAGTHSVDTVQLDAFGGALVYVNELVEVNVQSSTGDPVRTFVAGSNAGAVEVISPAFTGTDYTTAQRGVSKPTTLQAVLDSWAASAGAPDWKVRVGGSPTNIETAIASLAGLFFNVTSPEYGAIGDGVTDDTAAIQNAIDAAQAAAGGIVFFPSLDYLITELEWPPGVSFLGVGSARLLQNEAIGPMVSTTSADGLVIVDTWEGLGALRLQQNADPIFNIIASRKLIFRNQQFRVDANGTGGTSGPGWLVDEDADGFILLDGCDVLTVNEYGVKVDGASRTIGSHTLFVRLCKFLCSGTAAAATRAAIVSTSDVTCEASEFRFASAASGSACCVYLNSSVARGRFSGNHFIGSTAGGTICGISPTARFYEMGNYATDCELLRGDTSAVAGVSNVLLETRKGGTYSFTLSSDVVIDTAAYSMVCVTRPNGYTTDSTVELDDAQPPGAEFKVVYRNLSGFDDTLRVQFSGNTYDLLAANGETSGMVLTSVDIAGTNTWVVTGIGEF